MTNAELFKQTFGRYATEVWALPEDEFLEWLNADVQQNTGRWIRQTDDYHDYYECEHCGIAVGLDDIRNYCPNCGAKMEVDENDEGASDRVIAK